MRRAIRRAVKKHPLDACEMSDAAGNILDDMTEAQAASVRAVTFHMDDVIPKAGPYIATDVVMAVGALLDEEMD